MITGIHHASLLVADTGRSLLFYRDALGLAVDAGRPDMGFPGAWLKVGKQQIHLLELPDPDRSDHPDHGGRDRHLALQVSDLAGIAGRLDVAGVPHHRSRSGRRALFCRDPDGNVLEFIEMNTGSG